MPGSMLAKLRISAAVGYRLRRRRGTCQANYAASVKLIMPGLSPVVQSFLRQANHICRETQDIAARSIGRGLTGVVQVGIMCLTFSVRREDGRT